MTSLDRFFLYFSLFFVFSCGSVVGVLCVCDLSSVSLLSQTLTLLLNSLQRSLLPHLFLPLSSPPFLSLVSFVDNGGSS